MAHFLRETYISLSGLENLENQLCGTSSQQTYKPYMFVPIHLAAENSQLKTQLNVLSKMNDYNNC